MNTYTDATLWPDGRSAGTIDLVTTWSAAPTRFAVSMRKWTAFLNRYLRHLDVDTNHYSTARFHKCIKRTAHPSMKRKKMLAKRWYCTDGGSDMLHFAHKDVFLTYIWEQRYCARSVAPEWPRQRNSDSENYQLPLSSFRGLSCAFSSFLLVWLWSSCCNWLQPLSIPNWNVAYIKIS